MKTKVVVLVWGGGGGAGFASEEEKLCSPLLGRPAISYAVDAAAGLSPQLILLAPGSLELVTTRIVPGRAAVSVVRPRAGGATTASGIAAALLSAAPVLRKMNPRDLLFIPADRPLLQSRTLKGLVAAHHKQALSLTLMACGSDLDRDSLAAVRWADVVSLLASLARAGRKAGLRTLASLLSSRGKRIGLTQNTDPGLSLKLARRADLAVAAGLLRQRKNAKLSERGVTVLDPQTTWIDWEAEVGPGTVIYPSVVVEGPSRIGRDCRIYPYVHIIGCRVGDRAKVLSSTVLESSRLEADSQVGPFSRLRPGTVIRSGSKVGNFVEMKNTVFGPRSKAQHLSYLGDSLVEEDVNVGAGTITCNYDGVRKNRTHIGAGAFIGSGTELVAPVSIGKQAYVAAGSTITKDVSPASLAIGRARQVEKPGWVLERARKLPRKPR